MFIREARRQVSFFFRKVRNTYFRIMGIDVGKNVFISYGAWLDIQDGKIIIEDNVRITNGCKVLSHDHSAWITRGGKDICSVTTIKEGAFIGMNAIVLPGITVGKYAVVGAGCVISKDVPDGAILVGQSNRIVKMKNLDTGKYEKLK